MCDDRSQSQIKRPRAKQRAKANAVRRRGAEIRLSAWRKRGALEALERRLVLSAIPTSLAIAASQDQAVYGQSLTLTATVTALPSDPSEGTVAFTDGTTSLGSASVSSGTAILTNVVLAVGSHQITASYTDGSGSFASSSTIAQADSIITTFAGGGDSGPATQLPVQPERLAIDPAGNLFFADDSWRIRELEGE